MPTRSLPDHRTLPTLDSSPAVLPETRTIVRLRTTAFRTARGIQWRKTLDKLKKPSIGFSPFFDDEIGAVGDLDAVLRITNLTSVPDGIYELAVTNISRDWETGYADDWDYTLYPFTP